MTEIYLLLLTKKEVIEAEGMWNLFGPNNFKRKTQSKKESGFEMDLATSGDEREENAAKKIRTESEPITTSLPDSHST